MKNVFRRFQFSMVTLLASAFIGACGSSDEIGFIPQNPTSNPTNTPVTQNSYLLALSPTGEFKEFLIGTNAELSQQAVLPSAPNIADLALSPSNQSAYALQKDGTLRVFSVDRSSGTVNLIDTEATGSPLNGQCGLVVDPTGRYVVVISKLAQNPSGTSTISHKFFSVDRTTGILTPSPSNPSNLNVYSYEATPTGFDSLGHLYYFTMDFASVNSFTFLLAGFGLDANASVSQVANNVPFNLFGSFDAQGNPLVTPNGIVAKNGFLYLPSSPALENLITQFRPTLNVFVVGNSGNLTAATGSPIQDGAHGPGPGIISPGGTFGVSRSNIEPFGTDIDVGGLQTFSLDKTTGIPARQGAGLRTPSRTPLPKFFISNEILFCQDDSSSSSSFDTYRVNSSNGSLSLVSSVSKRDTENYAATSTNALFFESGGQIRSLQFSPTDGTLTLRPGGPTQAANSSYLTIPELPSNPQRGHGLVVYGRPVTN